MMTEEELEVFVNELLDRGKWLNDHRGSKAKAN